MGAQVRECEINMGARKFGARKIGGAKIKGARKLREQRYIFIYSRANMGGGPGGPDPCPFSQNIPY